MSRNAPLPGNPSIMLSRPFLDLPKDRLVATLRQAGLSFADDPSNSDPRFTRARFRAAMPALAREGLSAGRLALLARRARRAETALEAAVDEAAAGLWPNSHDDGGPIEMAAACFEQLPAEVALRLLGRAIAAVGDEGPVELGKLESLHADLAASPDAARFRRTLAGAIVTRGEGRLLVERAPPRRAAPKRP
jgi:tRNA(Ile)-lysidine synthase